MIINKTLRKKRSIIYAWMLSYISILLIPMVVSIIVYFESSNILAEEINKANESLLKEVQFAIDSQLLNIEKLALEISLNPLIKGLGYFNDSLAEAGQYNMIMKNIQVYKTSTSFLNNIYLYMNRNGSALSYNSFIPRDILFDRLSQNGGTSAEEWKNILNAKHFNDFIPVGNRDGNEQRFGMIAFVKSIQFDNKKNPSGNLMFLIDSSKLLESLRNIQWVNGGHVLIMDENNHVLASTGSLDDSFPLKYDDFIRNNDIIVSKAGNQELTVSYTVSNVTKWKYISIIPTNIIKGKLDYVRNITTVGWLLSIILGSLLTYLFLKRNYYPIGEIMRAIVQKANFSLDKKQNEYDFIQEAFSNTVGEKEKIKQTLDKQKRALRSNDLAKLIKGKLDDPDAIQDMLAGYGFKSYSATFLIMLFNIENKGPFFNDNKYFHELSDRSRFKLAELIVSNVVEELLGQRYSVIVTEIDDKISCIIFFTDEGVGQDGDGSGRNESYKTSIIEIVSEAKNFIEGKYDLSFKISASEIKNGLLNCPVAYREALDTMEYNNILGIKEIAFYDEININNNTALEVEYYYPIRAEKQLINCVKMGDSRMAGESLDDIFEHNMKNIPLSVSTAKFMMVHLISTMVKTLYELSIYFDDDFLENLNPLNRLLNCQNISDIRKEMRDILNLVCSYIELKRIKESSHQLRDSVMVVIANHFSDVNLNISMIGENLGLTPAYLSKLFKEQTGEGLLDYINKYRFEKAKVLLLSSDSQINEIAAKVGFVNSNTFIRAFKKYEGVTPGNYKKFTDLKGEMHEE
jgi:AraC-like DNA-binding protein